MYRIEKNLNNEIASAQNDHELYYGYLDVLENPDILLHTEGNGKGLRLYDDILTDAHASAVLQTRALSVAQQEFEIQPHSDDKQDIKVCDFVREEVKKLNIRQLIQDLMYGVLYGFSCIEIIWKKEGLRILPKTFLYKHPRRFVFNLDRTLKLRTRQNYLTGEYLPEKKFIYLPFGITDSPYGDGLGRRIWWCVWFKKHGVKYCLTYLDKFSSPIPVGKYPTGATDEQQQQLLDTLSAIQNDTAIVIPEDMDAKFMEAQRTGTPGYLEFCSFMDAQISKCVLGQTLTTELNEKGSFAASKTHEKVREDIKAADSSTIATCLNEHLIRWLVDLNFSPETPHPRINFVNRIEESWQTAKRDLELSKAFPVGARYMYEKYNIPEPGKDELILFEKDNEVKESKKFSDGENTMYFTESGEEAIQYLLKNVVPNISALFNPAFDMQTIESFEKNISIIYDLMYEPENVETIARAIFFQYITGYFSVDEPLNFASPTGEMVFKKPYEDQVNYFKSKGFVLSPYSYKDVWGKAHAQAFTCARVADMDILKDVHEHLADVMTTGATKKEFRKNMVSLLQKKGWYDLGNWDASMIPGRNNDNVIYEKPSLLPWHLDIIYRNNLATSFQVGRYDQLQKTKAVLPYWQYKSVQDASTRPEHALMHNNIYHANDKFWSRWYPPNGYNCRCFVVSLSEEQAKEKAKKDNKPLNPEWGGLPDEGWQYNVGEAGLDAWRPDWNRYPDIIKQIIPKQLELPINKMITVDKIDHPKEGLHDE